ncbi:acyl-CoA dehydrogenase [Streptomyces sp. SID10853]|uniref:acyl-CoA dehydrogenase family protein n=1 Tax=Streptomyces sp. SID10853 TaxID=2706028 RepID=UPI0013C0FE30|nr:acyl-CoA dehydrogenase family protein [Streptomyces sp. SID10853]NDZ78103.1 acyl-CoA dehydrogenase [Streptomyces sp. SID10853]
MRFGEEHQELRTAVRSLLARHEGTAAWGPLTQQIGAAGLAVPEEYGGAGCGPVEVHVVMEELGRVLAPVPYLGSAVLATQALLAAGDTELLPALADGGSTGALAWAENGSWLPEAIRAHAVRGPGGWRISGVKDHVLDGAAEGDGESADVLLVVARTEAGLALFHVPSGAGGVSREAHTTMDLTRPQATLTFDGAEARPVGADGDRVIAQVRDLACTALAAEQVGAAERCLELTVAHVRDRVQFGRPIGSFQAVKHRLADAFVRVESARSAALGASWAAADGSPDLPRYAAVAKSACSEAFSALAGDMIQLHGGIGITWEHDAHRYFKRAHGSAQLFGSPAGHRDRLADAVVGPRGAGAGRLG